MARRLGKAQADVPCHPDRVNTVPIITRWLQRAATERYTRLQLERRVMLHPNDEPRAEAPGSGDAARILLVGNGPLHGWGVASHQLAPTGELARGFRTLTGSGAVVEFTGDATMTVETARDWLPSTSHARYDAAVLALGTTCVVRFTAAGEWREHLVNLIGSVRGRLAPDAPILLVGVPDVFISHEVQLLPRLMRPHAVLLDHVSRSVADGLGQVTFVPAPKLAGSVGSAPDESLYAAFSTPLALQLAGLIDLSVPVVATIDGASDVETVHPVVQAVLDAWRWDELPELTAVLQRIRDDFGVLETSVNLVGERSSWAISAAHGIPSATPRALSFTDHVVRSGRPLLVPDARKDHRFTDVVVAKLSGLTFYLGVPIRLADGTVIGALSLFDREEPEVDPADIVRLQAAVADVLGAVETAVARTETTSA